MRTLHLGAQKHPVPRRGGAVTGRVLTIGGGAGSGRGGEAACRGRRFEGVPGPAVDVADTERQILGFAIGEVGELVTAGRRLVTGPGVLVAAFRLLIALAGDQCPNGCRRRTRDRPLVALGVRPFVLGEPSGIAGQPGGLDEPIGDRLLAVGYVLIDRSRGAIAVGQALIGVRAGLVGVGKGLIGLGGALIVHLRGATGAGRRGHPMKLLGRTAD
ncbi:MAG: hypothetical protein ACRDPE_08240 [Solirubrobacterales bacterium]